MMKKIKKGKIRSVKDIKVVVRFKGQSEAVLYTNALGEKFYSDSALYGDIFPVNGALCEYPRGGEQGNESEAEFFRQAFRRRNATAKIMRMSNYCSSTRGMLTETLREKFAGDLFTGTGGLNLPYTDPAYAEFEPLPFEDIYMSRKKYMADSKFCSETAKLNGAVEYEQEAVEVRVHTEYRDREEEDCGIEAEGDENPSGYVEVSTTGKLIEYERHYMISYSEYYLPFDENDFRGNFDGQRNVSVLIFKNNPDVIMISYNEFNDEFLTFVKNKTTVDFYSDDFNEPYSGFDAELYEERDVGIDYLTINTGDVSTTINSDNGDLKLNYTVGLFSGMLGFAEYSLKYQVL